MSRTLLRTWGKTVYAGRSPVPPSYRPVRVGPMVMPTPTSEMKSEMQGLWEFRDGKTSVFAGHFLPDDRCPGIADPGRVAVRGESPPLEGKDEPLGAAGIVACDPLIARVGSGSYRKRLSDPERPVVKAQRERWPNALSVEPIGVGVCKGPGSALLFLPVPGGSPARRSRARGLSIPLDLDAPRRPAGGLPPAETCIQRLKASP